MSHESRIDHSGMFIEPVESVSFSRARAAALRILTASELVGKVFLEGGLVPWVVSGSDSGRLHGDVDLSVRIADMPSVRMWLTAEGLYNVELDSLHLPCNEGRNDFGVHAVVDGVLVSFCPYYFEDAELHQRNAAIEISDGFDALLEAVMPDFAEADLIETRRLPGGEVVGCSTLEFVRAAKMTSAHEKDVNDLAEIDRIGYDAARFARIATAYDAMRIDCLGHGK